MQKMMYILLSFDIKININVYFYKSHEIFFSALCFFFLIEILLYKYLLANYCIAFWPAYEPPIIKYFHMSVAEPGVETHGVAQACTVCYNCMRRTGEVYQ